MRLVHASILIALCFVAIGCTRRTITITSEPTGALCWLNGREVGRTPVTVDFIYYGTYDVQLQAEGYEPLLTTGEASAPIWDHIPLDLVSEITPPEKHAKVAWHYVMEPPNDDPAGLVDRARDFRAQIGSASTAAEELPAAPTAATPR